MDWVTKYSAGENEQKTGRPGQLPYRPVWFSHGYAPERCVCLLYTSIGINHWMAIHGAYADDQRYIWDDDKLRGSDVLPGFSGVTKTNGTQYRWIEAQENTGAVVLIYYLMRAGRL